MNDGGVALRSGRGQIAWQRRRRRSRRSFAYAAFAFALFPQQVSYSDIASLIASQPAVMARAHKHVIASPFGTIHAATFSFPRPPGTAIPRPLATQLVALNHGNPLGDPAGFVPLGFPKSDRSRKVDAEVARPRPDRAEAAEALLPPVESFFETEFRAATAATADDVELPYSDLPQPDLVVAARAGTDMASDSASSRLFFGIDPTSTVQSIVPWAPGEEPVLLEAVADPEIKLSALVPEKPNSLSQSSAEGVSVAPKGQVTGPERRPKTPAERLGLKADSKQRAKAEKCLANAVYFEARSEPIRGQMAVAQVVMNRVFSGFYPNDVCGAVYQNAHRHLACQFTFACDGIPDVVTEPEAWSIAKRIARDTLDGKLWLPEISRSTHYHAYWVRPSWIREMRRILKLGVHTFYRPRRWGDGADMPKWGDAAHTRDEAQKLEEQRKG